MTPFFSRRIGLNEGKQIPINYGARLSGQLGNYELGFIQANTKPVENMSGENFTVARVKRALLKQSYLGFVYTDRSSSKIKADSSATDQSLYGTDSVSYTHLTLPTSDLV